MKSVVIYYFSGTGNTEIVANMIKEGFFNYQYNVTVIRIEDVLKNNLKIDLEKYDLVGIGCQVIGFGTPNIVRHFIKLLPKQKYKKTFIFRTAGGVTPINYNASKPIIRKLSRKGYKVFYERLFSIGSNWMNKFDDEIIKQLYAATAKKADIMCQEVIHGKKRTLKTGIGLKVLMEGMMFIISRIIFLLGKDLKVNENCSHCGLCIKNCPAENIYEKNEKINFRLSCNGCMRCVYSCPKSAINFKSLTSFPIPGGYNIKEILKQPSGDGKIKNKVPPFFDSYIKDDTL
ncbi:EFR1 family ferrodoxin [Clostridium sp. AWRP]|uniref:EFR1 family ferrodoxin n=1 Tax=Clostridium sp. AWRP TaxID=2212991 RepID=UPI000FD9470A|nr:EFR1 family ferrodoxin [Clostridium sp. AWRP]AZV57870.1 4Fe-4S dicluster domain-containing protein [Clostridium sp. AWRP]